MEQDEEDVFEFSDVGAFSNRFSVFEEMRISGEFCDVTIKTGHECFIAHSNILAASVPYFRAMLSSKMVEGTQKEVTMTEIDSGALKCLIDFAYGSELKIAGSKVQFLLEASIYLQLDRVVNACFKYLRRRLNPDNVLKIRACAELVNNLDMMESADNYIRRYFNDVSMSETFTDLPFHLFNEFISSDDLHVKSEEMVFEAVMKWVKASEIDREAHLPELLGHIRLFRLSTEFLVRRVSTEELVLSSPPCRDMLESAKRYHRIPKEVSACCTSSVLEQYGKEKHHLNCARTMGGGLYAVCGSMLSKSRVSYYDHKTKSWPTLAHSDTIGYSDYIFCTEEKIYFLRNKRIRSLHLRTLRWSCSRLPDNIPSAAGIALHYNKIYFFGGSGNTSDAVYCYDFQRGTCVQAGKMVINRTSPGVVSLGEYIYSIGGYYGSTIIKSVEKYSSVTEQSVEIAPTLIRRYYHSCTVLNEKIYVYGGISRTTMPYDFISTGEVYNPLTNQWNFLTKANFGDTSLVSHGGKLYAIRSDVNDENVFEVEICDPAKNEWKSGKPVPSETEYVHLSAFVTNSAVAPEPLPFGAFVDTAGDDDEVDNNYAGGPNKIESIDD